MQFILLLSLSRAPPPPPPIFNRIKLFQKISKISMPSYIKIYPLPLLTKYIIMKPKLNQ